MWEEKGNGNSIYMQDSFSLRDVISTNVMCAHVSYPDNSLTSNSKNIHKINETNNERTPVNYHDSFNKMAEHTNFSYFFLLFLSRIKKRRGTGILRTGNENSIYLLVYSYVIVAMMYIDVTYISHTGYAERLLWKE
jgi:hypothetical protein